MQFTVLHFWNIFTTIQNLVVVTIHSISTDLNLVAGAGLQSHFTAAGEVSLGTLAVGVMYCLDQLVTIDEEVGCVTLPALNPGPQTVVQSPCSRHGHSEDQCDKYQYPDYNNTCDS